MSELTPNQVAAQLSELARELDAAVDRLDGAEKDAVNKREDYSQDYAKSYLAAEGSIEARKHIATTMTGESRVAAELAEQHVKALRRQIDSVKIRIEVGRSLGAALRSEAALAGSGWNP